MDDRRLEQLAAVCGLAFVVLLVGAIAVGASVFGEDPGDCDPRNARFAVCLLDHRTAIGAFIFLNALGASFFLVFLGGLFSALRRAEGRVGGPILVALVGGVAWASLWLAASAMSAAPLDLAGYYQNPEGARTADVLAGTMLLDTGSGVTYLPLAMLLGATSLAALRTRAFPRWLGWMSGVVAVLFVVASGLVLILEVWVVPLVLLLFWLWVSATSIVLMLRSKGKGVV